MNLLRRLLSIAVAVLAAPGCDWPPNGNAVVGSTTRDASTLGTCQVCLTADVCCAAHTDNVAGNCKLHATCLMFTGAERASVEDGCAYYLRIASTPPGPAACGPHPDAP
jgi:hypothetical protein